MPPNETPTSSMALVEVGSPEAVEPHHMKNASAYLEEQYPKYTYVPDQNSPPEAIAIEPDKEKQHELDGKTVSPKRTVFGIRRRWFVIGVVVALIVIAAAIGGGVGGSMAHKNKKDDAEAEAATFTSSVGQGDSTDEASQATSASTSALVVTKTITETAADSTQVKTMTTTTKTDEATKTTETATETTESCAEGTVADGESLNYMGLCKFSCGYGYCPPGPCTCVATGKPKETPPVKNVRGCPLPELSDGYLGLCSFACNHGYCPETACTTKCDDR
ncbi:hypothetical protein FVEN_g9566 [Fusarium venenatum]|uniref:Uncharacterized protein n=1 Tax=Fusarium venenatum TaxID=56646 RepID=A0A2L2TPK2_9HYPO|nr:uncharacterized protein FVRRES_04273 [Fusarium venenatum]KAG8352421.1 hypothetical protein FVEN_g9566 [Fusarium venenatum]KAH7002778.1 hypothetical protein EDB82DRAFT_518852 [Fusarium venenatum]CEI67761.1 unnamed protein product [Fusarium venenatum]